METPTAGAVLEYVNVLTEAFCARLPPKERVAFLRGVEEIFERQEAGLVVADLAGQRAPLQVRIDRRGGHLLFRETLPKLIEP